MQAPEPPLQPGGIPLQPDQDPQEEPARDWVPVSSWTSPIQDGLDDLRRIREVIDLLKDGPSGHREHAACMQLLDIAQRTRRGEVAALILAEHGIELPDQPGPS